VSHGQFPASNRQAFAASPNKATPHRPQYPQKEQLGVSPHERQSCPELQQRINFTAWCPRTGLTLATWGRIGLAAIEVTIYAVLGPLGNEALLEPFRM